MSDVFIKKNDAPQLGFSVGVMLNRKETKGQVGLEIEVEGNKFPKPEGYEGTHQPVRLNDSTFWSYVHDGSLRGADNAEYVLTKPVMFDKVPEAIDDIFSRMASYGSVISESNRTSVHVHLNCQDFHLNRLTALLALYFTFEEVLTEWCGDHRVGNLFCLRAIDAPAIVSQVKKFIRTDGSYQLQDHLHYSGLNTNALFKLGSLEWRTLRGCSDPQIILNWVAILQRLYELSADFQDPREICSMFSGEGPSSFFDNVLGPHAKTVRDGIEFDNDRIGESMYEGIRMAQDICYCRDWSRYQPQRFKVDPFGRDPRKLAKKLATGSAPPSVDMSTLQVLGNTWGLDAASVPTSVPLQFYNNPEPDVEEEYEPEEDYDDESEDFEL